MKNLKIVVGIPTFKRPHGLRRLLESVAVQIVDHELIVLVADNEGDGGIGLVTVQQILAERYPLQLSAIAVNERGISQVRNALMSEAFDNIGADMLAMIDDDEWVEPQWISALVKVQQQTKVDVVGGSVSPEFEVTPPNWIKGLNIYYQSEYDESGIVPLVSGTTNVLLSRSIIDKYPGERFDPYYSLVGGGDKEFFTRLKRLGATFAFAHEAKAHEIFGASRLTKKWAIERSYRIGAGDIRIISKNNPSTLTWIKETIKLIGAIVVSTVAFVLMIAVPHKRMKARLKFSRQMGKISALLGIQKQVYRNVHGN
ncbi:glycosyltransferase family 2 protein [Rheinheimera tangshanensis]|uniref:Glycosyltransferase family 2 protein n=1 Tax=Rheinheimera tangshanensis TaxID=400153 RepID=A0A5C8LTB3_9GAMM|nr:glycosyltransferase [Rheinheimera tangshanensis]TXK80556.1 glycosyltransferase family 2 protein [Rheinheimera tangshanensis]GGM60337.1 glycosyl transferase family A [Rheinheimera tangshanensis]